MNLNALALRFMSLYAGLERAYGAYRLDKVKGETAKLGGRAATEHKPVTAELWEQHLSGNTGIGIVPIRDDATVMWAALDIDKYQDFDLVELEKTLHEMNLPLVLLRSKSGGAHLTLFCNEPITAAYVRSTLSTWSGMLGFQGVEIFPKQTTVPRAGDVGNWLNMPYFKYDDTERYAVYEGKKLNVEEFLELAESRKKLITKATLSSFAAGDDILQDGPPCLEHLSKEGFPRGSRNRGLFNLGVLTRLAVGEEWQNKVDEFNRLYMQPPLSTSEVATTLKSLSRKKYFYTCTQDPIVSVCNKPLCKQRKFGIGEGKDDKEEIPPIIESIKVIKSAPPLYIINLVLDKQIECDGDTLLKQSIFRRMVMDTCMFVPPTLKQKDWDEMINGKLADAEVIDAPADASSAGQFRDLVEVFCTSRVMAATRDEILLGKPYLDDEHNRVVFRSKDLIKFLKRENFEAQTNAELWASLRQLGAGSQDYKIKGKTYAVWWVPAFAPANEEPLDTPKDIDVDDM